MRYFSTLRLSVAAVLLATTPSFSIAQQPVVIRGGWLFTATTNDVVRNRGVLVRGGVLQVVNGAIAPSDTAGARIIQLDDSSYVLPGIFDLHAHYNMTLGPEGQRSDEYTYNPLIFLANGVTSTFPAGEYDPEGMMATRKRIDAGLQIGPRIYNTGPYFGTARPGWNQKATTEDIYREVDQWAALGARGFKAKGISPQHLQPLIERAHLHGLTVTGHLESGVNNSVNPKDAILMGIDRVEHVLGGDALDPKKPAYPSWIVADPKSKEVRDIIQLYISHGVAFDATITAPVYLGRLQEGFDYWIDERKFFTPEVQAWVRDRAPRRANGLMDSLYWAMRRTTKAFYDAGGFITLGTDNPSRGEFIAGFSSHRELHALVLAGIPPAAALKIGTINGARALNVGNKLGSLEPGKWADLFIVRGNPLRDIKNTRRVQLVMKSGMVYDPAELLKMAEGKIGFSPTRGATRASTDPRDVVATVERFFASMRTRDTSALRSMSAADLVVVSSRVDTSGKTTVRRQAIADMLRGIASSADELRERMWDADVKIDGDVAMLWAPYDFHVGSRFSHCGTDSFQLVRQSGGWVVTGLSYTVRSTGCPRGP